MSKIRIYELAKELGVENKIIIAHAQELDLIAKPSHSSSLEADEADQIRRAIIRTAVGRETEVVKTRVDRVTGETEAVVESRKGNVIRRRKHSQLESDNVGASGAGSQGGAQVNFTGGGLASGGTPMPISTRGISELEDDTAEGTVAGETLETHTSERIPFSGHPAEVLDSTEETVAASAEAISAPPEEQAKNADRTSGIPAAVEEEGAKKAPPVGPKVLGKIELPQKRMTVAPDKGAPRKEGVPAAVAEEETEEEASGKREGFKKKGRKREISRIDLLDYEGKESRRPQRMAQRARARDDDANAKQTEITRPKASKRVVRMAETITVGELAKQMSLKVGEVIAKLMELGVLATINQAIDKDTASIISEEFEFQIESTEMNESSILEEAAPENTEDRAPRSPVVTVMGHVDHGKTSLLDAIRETSVAAKEHGGITQHIGAYRVTLKDGRSITFIDTPGHAAFTSMRARGAQVTDIVVLVVAADDGVMPQTIEAINHAKAAKVSLVVALNKMDRPGVNVERIKQQLAEHGISPEDWGGDSMFFPVSALKGQGIKELLEGILLVAEVKELRANPIRRARGAIIEAKQDKGRGSVATVLIQNGTLRIGDVFVCGAEFGRVRSLCDENGTRLEEAGPSTPVEITGFSGLPAAGDDFFVVESEASAKEVYESRAVKKQAKEQRSYAGPISLEEFARRANNIAALELNIILKADVHGSLEAAADAVEKLSTPKVRVKVIHSAVGGVNESDVQLALASKAIIIGFGVRAESRALQDAEASGVEIRFYRIIYELLDDVRKAMAGLLAPVNQEVHLGRVEVREVFNIPKMGSVAGCSVTEGTVKRSSFVRLLRDSKVVHEGKIASLRRFKDDVREVQSGYECGIMLESYNDVKPGDTMEVFELKEVAATLE